MSSDSDTAEVAVFLENDWEFCDPMAIIGGRDVDGDGIYDLILRIRAHQRAA